MRFLPLLILVGLSGCAAHVPRYALEINALAAEPISITASLPASNYLLLPADPEFDDRDLQHREFERVLEVALADRGLRRVDQANDADIAILMRYGIGESQTEIVQTSTPYHVLNDYRFYDRYDRRRGRRRRGRFYGYRGFNRFPYANQTRSRVTVNRFLQLEARALESEQNPRAGEPVWSTEARSRGTLNDLRRIFPVLASAAVEHIATDSGQIIETTISEDEERILRLRPANPSPDIEGEPSLVPVDSKPSSSY